MSMDLSDTPTLTPTQGPQLSHLCLPGLHPPAWILLVLCPVACPHLRFLSNTACGIQESGLGATAWSPHHLLSPPAWGRGQGRSPGALTTQGWRGCGQRGHGPAAPPQPSPGAQGVSGRIPPPAGRVPAALPPPWETLLLFQLYPRRRAVGAPDPFPSFKSALKGTQIAMPGRGRLSSARICNLPKAC